ncbi:MAG: transcriptional repressor [Pseudomonadota bacterium]|nr:transcriptional repressor [Pseudomonadota bacterium]
MSTEQYLRQAGVKPTRPRLLVLDALQLAEQRYLTADEVYLWLSRQQHRLGLASVYRVLADLEQAGLVRRHQFDKAKACYERVSGAAPLIHLVNTRDGDIVALENEALLASLKQAAGELGFDVLDMELKVFVSPSEPALAGSA